MAPKTRTWKCKQNVRSKIRRAGVQFPGSMEPYDTCPVDKNMQLPHPKASKHNMTQPSELVDGQPNLTAHFKRNKKQLVRVHNDLTVTDCEKSTSPNGSWSGIYIVRTPRSMKQGRVQQNTFSKARVLQQKWKETRNLQQKQTRCNYHESTINVTGNRLKVSARDRRRITCCWNGHYLTSKGHQHRIERLR